MNITIVEHGSLGLCLARNLSRYHRVHLLRSQESALDEPLAELDGVLTPVDQQGLQNDETGLVVTDATNIAFAHADHIIITPPVEYGGRHERYNALLCEATLQEVLTYNATANIALQTLVPLGFSDRISREFSVPRLVHAFLSPPAQSPALSRADHGRLVLGGPASIATDHASLLRQAVGEHFRDILVDRSLSESVALLAAQIDTSSPHAIRQVLAHAQRHGLNGRVLIECLGLLIPVRGASESSAGIIYAAPHGLARHSV